MAFSLFRLVTGFAGRNGNPLVRLGSLLQAAGPDVEEELLSGFKSAEELLPSLSPGDLIEFDRGKYCHWAMYSDSPGYVFNIPAEGKDQTRVKITLEKLIDVAGNSFVRKNNKFKSARMRGLRNRPVHEAIQDASAVLNTYVPYNFMGENCEFYCTKWKFGVGFTDQVEVPSTIIDTFIGTFTRDPLDAFVSAAAEGAILNAVSNKNKIISHR